MKVRCRTCSEPIRVDGTLLGVGSPESAQVMGSEPVATPEQMARVQIPGSNPPSVRTPSHVPVSGDPNAVWHIAVGDTTQGPYTIEELREYYAQGSVLLDTPVFRDGWSEWRSAGDIAELRARAVSQPGAAAFRGGVSMGSDPFGERAASGPRVSAAQMMQEGGSGKDSTVQFSLDQIRALSSVSSASIPAPRPASIMPPASEASMGFGGLVSSTPSIAPSAGYASGEGSGLIDVRKLAELHATMQRDEEAPVQAEPLLDRSGYSQTLAPLSLPLPPRVPEAGGLDSRTKLFAGLASFGMVLAAAVAVVALTREPAGVSASVQAETPSAAAATAQPVPSAALADEDEEAQAAPSEGEKAAAEQVAAAEAKPEAAAAAEDESAGEEEKSEKKSSSSRRDKRGARTASKSDKADKVDDVLAEAPKKKEAAKSDDLDDMLEKPSAKKSSGGSIDDLLDGAIAGASKKPGTAKPAPAPEAKPASNLPQTPSRDEMLASLSKAKSKVASCKGSGVATAAIKIAGSGKVTSVDVSGVDGAAKSCVEKAVKSTSFPKFQKESFDVKFPFKLGK